MGERKCGKHKRIHNDHQGFSLIELIVVIAIMAVLVGVIGASLFSYIEKAKRSQRIQTIDNLMSVGEIFVTDKIIGGEYNHNYNSVQNPILINSSMNSASTLDKIATEYFKETFGTNISEYSGWIYTDVDGKGNINRQIWTYTPAGSTISYRYDTNKPGEEEIIRNQP